MWTIKNKKFLWDGFTFVLSNNFGNLIGVKEYYNNYKLVVSTE